VLDAGAPRADAGTPAVDAGRTTTTKDGGCSAAPGTPRGAGLAGLALVVGALVVRRRRR
jgi:MYXO-CTERM domain-containing protein